MHAKVEKSSLGVLNLRGGNQKFMLNRYAPSEELGFFVKHYWIIHWDLTGQEPYLQDVVPNPCVNLAIDDNDSGIYGVLKSKFTKCVEGKGCVFGVKFKPGGFYPFIKRPASRLIHDPFAIGDVFGEEALSIVDAIRSEEDDERMVELGERLIQLKLPEKDETVTLINRIIDRVIEDRELTKVDHICERFSINKRKLQRMFDQYVGASPKWVIQLYRIHNAAEILDQGHQDGWLKLSLDLGYYDQAHFIKDFKAIIGKTPEEYAGALFAQKSLYFRE